MKYKKIKYRNKEYYFDHVGAIDSKNQKMFVGDLIRFGNGNLYEIKRKFDVRMEYGLPVPEFSYVLSNCLGETIPIEINTVVNAKGIVIGDILNDFHVAAQYAKEKKGE